MSKERFTRYPNVATQQDAFENVVVPPQVDAPQAAGVVGRPTRSGSRLRRSQNAVVKDR